MQIDEDDIVYRRESRGRSSTELVIILAVGIACGTLLANTVQLLAVTAYAKYQIEMATRQLQRELASEQENRQQRENTRAREAVHQQEELRRNRILNSDLCRFWTEQSQRNPGQKTSAGVKEHCSY